MVAVCVGKRCWVRVWIIEGFCYRVPGIWPGSYRIVPSVGLGCGVDAKAVHKGSLVFIDICDGVEKKLEGNRPKSLHRL